METIVFVLIATIATCTSTGDLVRLSNPLGTTSNTSVGLEKGTVFGGLAGGVGGIGYNGTGNTTGTDYNIQGDGHVGDVAVIPGQSHLRVNETGVYGEDEGFHNVAGVVEQEHASGYITKDGVHLALEVLAKNLSSTD